MTLGQFSMVRLERDSQLLIPMYDYCMPTGSAPAATRTGTRIPARSSARSASPWGEFFPQHPAGDGGGARWGQLQPQQLPLTGPDAQGAPPKRRALALPGKWNGPSPPGGARLLGGEGQAVRRRAPPAGW